MKLNHYFAHPPEKISPPFHGLLPVFQLYNPGMLLLPTIIAVDIGLLLGAAAIGLLQADLWVLTLITLLCLLPVGIHKWRADRQQHGWVVMLLSITLISQGAHTIEHFVQFFQYHVLYFTMRQSNGLLSAANAEWVHFAWNWAVLIVVILMLKGGLRNLWSWILLLVAIGHTIEHTYTFIRYLIVLKELQASGITTLTAQGLAGICGRDGLLARSALTYNSFLRYIPGLTTAIRLDVHFWWNAIEMTFLLLAGNTFLRHYIKTQQAAPAEAYTIPQTV